MRRSAADLHQRCATARLDILFRHVDAALADELDRATGKLGRYIEDLALIDTGDERQDER
jgi:hypothetical protein